MITTGARLHFGLMSHRSEVERNFSGLGLMIDVPRVRIFAKTIEADDFRGEQPHLARLESFVRTYRAACPADRQPPPCRMAVLSAIPPHAGLGSGTQLGMAVAKSLAVLAGDDAADAATLAARVGRGLRSSIGIHGFAQGGLFVDGGKAPTDTVGSIDLRLHFPADWRFVLVVPGASAGLSGDTERDAFQRLTGMSAETTRRLGEIASIDLIPAVGRGDFDACSEALFEYGRLVGEYFAPVQGGIYANAAMARLVDDLRGAGVRGVGQSSWGPTIFALLRDDAAAKELAGELAGSPYCLGASIHIAGPLNTGASLFVTESGSDSERGSVRGA